MEQAVLERRVRVIPATKTAPASGPRHSGKQRVAAYCRVSTSSEEQLNSYEAQKNYYTQKIEENPDWEMAGIFADEGLSGTSLKKRAEFNRMIAACKRGRIDMILTKSTSRFARNTVDCLKVIRTLKDCGIAIIFEKENINTLDKILGDMGNKELNAQLEAVTAEKQDILDQMQALEKDENQQTMRASRQREMEEWLDRQEMRFTEYEDSITRRFVEQITVVDADTIQVKIKDVDVVIDRKLC